jgi:hypothetical protein
MSSALFSIQELESIVQRHGGADTIPSGSGSALRSTYGGRLLGLFPRADLPNTLWVHQSLERLMSAGQWLIGGERLWIAPERSYYYENPRDFEGYHVPTGIDPGEYVKSTQDTYTNTFTLLNLLTNEIFDGSTIQRTMRPLSDPLHSGLAFAGVSIADEIRVPQGSSAFAAWSITQLYTGGAAAPGTVVIPTKANASTISYFSPIPSQRLVVDKESVRFAIDGSREFKLGVAPEHLRGGIIAYLSSWVGHDEWFCVIKRSDSIAQNQQECVDIAKGDPEGPRGAVQSYNSGPELVADEPCVFGEIELQFKRATKQQNHLVSSAPHELLSYAGSKEEMVQVVQQALALDTPPTLF